MSVQKRRIITGLLFSTSAIFIALVLAELSLRVFHPVHHHKPPKKLSNTAWYKLLHRPSSVPGLAYELAPNRKKYSHGAMIQTNSWGMRDDEPRPKDENSLHRIIVLGDSFTFGFGVPGEYTYPNVLEKLLKKGISSEQFEVLNLAVGGYSTRDEALVLKYKGITWNPDLVIIGYCLNDPEIEAVSPLHYYFQKPRWWQHSNLLRLIAKTKILREIKVLGQRDYYKYLHSPQHPKWQSVVKAFKEIAKLAHKRKIPVLLLIFPQTINKPWIDYPYQDLHQQVADAAKEECFSVIDLYENYSQYPPETLMIRPGDSHPSLFGHEVAANAIYQWISTNKEFVALFSTREDNRH